VQQLEVALQVVEGPEEVVELQVLELQPYLVVLQQLGALQVAAGPELVVVPQVVVEL
tara:strand:+ start:173 stop:343 length:171 start_codon:yes stop_codon:yes gene_type:complete